MKVSDIILGSLVAGIGLIALIAASMQPKPFFGSGYGGGFFPSIVGVALVLAGAMLTLSSLRDKTVRPLVIMGDWVRSPRHVSNVAVVLASLVFYIFFSNALGFIVTSLLVMFATLVQFTRDPVRSAVVAAVTTIVVKIGFQDFLLVPLQWGILEQYAGALSWR